MFDIGWSELLLVAMITLVVVGPQEIPRVLRTVRGLLAKIRGLSADFQSAMDEAAREADLSGIKEQLLKDKPDMSSDAAFQKILGEQSVQEIQDLEKSMMPPPEMRGVEIAGEDTSLNHRAKETGKDALS